MNELLHDWKVTFATSFVQRSFPNLKVRIAKKHTYFHEMDRHVKPKGMTFCCINYCTIAQHQYTVCIKTNGYCKANILPGITPISGHPVLTVLLKLAGRGATIVVPHLPTPDLHRALKAT